jgi:acyl-CoA reductase-like NAD-dependent aldehyde dehydrogenase
LHGGGADVGQQLIEHAGLDFFTFTGSTPVGKKIREARGMGHVALELGSIAATIVCADADLEKAAPCASPSRASAAWARCAPRRSACCAAWALDKFLPAAAEGRPGR